MTTRVVIIGAGFGGLSAGKTLAGQPIAVTIVDQRNYHLFQPLLYQVATAGLSPADIAWPVRGILGRHRNIEILMDKVTGVDTEARTVECENHRLEYDHLVIASGARHAYFGHPEWEQHAPGLKDIEDATDIRRRILLAFEQAESSDSRAEQQRLLTFVVVGAGPTGVEMAGALAEVAHKTLAKDFQHIDPSKARILLVEAGPKVLGSFPENLSNYAEATLKHLLVEVVTGKAITACEQDGVTIGEDFLPCGTVIWAAGVKASPAADWLKVEADRAGRIPVNEQLQPHGIDNVYVVGDTAAMTTPDGDPVPGIAPAAKQAGRYAAKRILFETGLGENPGRFRYKHAGNLATIGRNAAVIDFGKVRLKGILAWWLWGVAHIYFLIGVRSPMLVALQWFWSYLTFGKGARLITGAEAAKPEDKARRD